MIHWTTKSWGRLLILPSVTEGCETHSLQINKYKKCSRHMHKNKRNLFHVLSGALTIHVWTGDLYHHHELGVGETLIVEAGDEHQFETQGLGCACLEQYWNTDIIRNG